MILLLLLILSIPIRAQVAAPFGTGYLWGTVVPSSCRPGDLFSKTSVPVALYSCPAGLFVEVGLVAPGQITLVLSGTCPAGFSEVVALNGKTLVGTLAANGNVGTTGGSDTITPAGTVAAPNFTGNALATHTHTITGGTGAISAGVPGGSVAAIAATATAALTSPAGASQNTANNTHTHPAPAFTGVAMPTHLHGVGTLGNSNTSGGTPSGTNSAPPFTGTAFDNRSAFVRVIFCSKN